MNLKKIHRILILIPLLCLCKLEFSTAQNLEESDTKTFTSNVTTKTIVKKSYKVQIYIGNNYLNANSVKKRFLSYFPDSSVSLTYNKPKYKVQVGDFIEKNDAVPLHEMAQNCFKNVFIVPVYKRIVIQQRDKSSPITNYLPPPQMPKYKNSIDFNKKIKISLPNLKK